MRFCIVTVCILALALASSAEQCGKQYGNATCPDGQCCSRFGWCGTTQEHCHTNCESQCPPAPPPPTVGDPKSIITESVYRTMLLHQYRGACESHGFYTHKAFIKAAEEFPGFGTTGSTEQRKQELAAFFAQTSYVTTGESAKGSSDPYSWGYCIIERKNDSYSFCTPQHFSTCPPGVKYYPRGPFQFSDNDDYELAGYMIRADLRYHPELVATDPVISFKTAIWYWMHPHRNRTSMHNVMTGKWSPSADDKAANRVPGFGLTTNVLNGKHECNKGNDSRVGDRIGFYKSFCEILDVDYGKNLDCYNQKPYS